jgi:hypothetical protein
LSCRFQQASHSWHLTDVAVVGLPTPRKNHATVMARFARDCRVKLSEVLEELEEKLGVVRIPWMKLLLAVCDLLKCLFLCFPPGHARFVCAIWLKLRSDDSGCVAR